MVEDAVLGGETSCERESETMSNEIQHGADRHVSPFERIRRMNEAGGEYWSSRDFAAVLEYGDYRNFEAVVEKAKLACFNSAHRVEDHFVDVTEMIEIGKGGQRPVKTVFMSRYACYLAIQNADPRKEIVAQGQTYFAVHRAIRREGVPAWDKKWRNIWLRVSGGLLPGGQRGSTEPAPLLLITSDVLLANESVGVPRIVKALDHCEVRFL